RFCSALLWILLFTSYAIHRRVNGTPAWTAMLHPAGALILAYIVLRSMFLTLRRGGVVWRDTFYPLKTLRSANLPDPDPLR
ncbi:MAG: hypothetical protein HY291_10075, partial [Planctomycetes bacterium]|nr:hypothetical protein [Planctomycetota bacterium]